MLLGSIALSCSALTWWRNSAIAIRSAADLTLV
jgi:hypothetical protein